MSKRKKVSMTNPANGWFRHVHCDGINAIAIFEPWKIKGKGFFVSLHFRGMTTFCSAESMKEALKWVEDEMRREARVSSMAAKLKRAHEILFEGRVP